MTIADTLIAEGEAKGLAKGRTEGRTEGLTEGHARVLSKQLTLKFGEVPPEYQARLANASFAEFDLWAERLFSATSLDEVFAAPPGS